MNADIKSIPIQRQVFADEVTIKAIIHSAVINAVKEIIAKQQVEKPVQLKEASEFFSMNPHSLMKKAKLGEIPYYRFKGKRSPYYFYKSQIEEVLLEGKVKTMHDFIGAEFHNTK
tara:strand:+ start:2338 stop:2682 length:345 start_codon:yes stop_codon:yes gene_type:complete